jgi:GAF domain-containing protein
VPAELETVQASLVNLLESPTVRSEESAGRGEPGLRRLQRVFGDLKSGLASATVALNLMQLVSESYERAVIFLVKRDRLAPLGAFGFARNGSPLANAVRRLEIAPSGLLQEALASSQVRTANFQNANLPSALAAILGPPVNDQVVVFPVAGSERVIAAVYADNGASPRPLRDVELLEVAAEQVGIAFENELLRRQLGR